MNIFFKIGEWWERRRVVRWQMFSQSMVNVGKRLDECDLSIRESAKVPTGTANELKAIRIRLDQLELYVGLKREKKPETIPGAARIA